MKKLIFLLLAIIAPILAQNLPPTTTTQVIFEKKAILQTQKKQKIFVKMALTNEQKNKGLSGPENEKLEGNQGMFFFYEQSGPRKFWMMNTYLNLDIFFMTKDLKIIKVYRDLKKHPSTEWATDIQQTDTVNATHVLELPAKSKISKSLKEGDQLFWVKN
ncbi:MAG: DUF192 domain-containing protein [Elusimicrobiota bacterium]